jgi:hypothetical protein
MRSEGNIHISNFKMMLCFAALYDMGTGKVKPLVEFQVTLAVNMILPGRQNN